MSLLARCDCVGFKLGHTVMDGDWGVMVRNHGFHVSLGVCDWAYV